MSVTIQYKGWSFEFESLPSSTELQERYRAFIERPEIVMPVPTPVPLERDAGPYRAEELGGRRFLVCAFGSADRTAQIEAAIDAAIGDAGGQTSRTDESGDEKLSGLVCDMSTASTRAELDELFEFVQKHLQRLRRSSHIVILAGRIEDAETAEQASIWEGTDGFVRTLAKELGPTGSTINRFVIPSSDIDLAGPLAFFLSPRSAYVTGQTVVLGPSERRVPAPSRTRILEGKVAVVTGAARGIGRATAIQFANEGATVIGLDLPSGNALGEEGSEALLEALRAKHGILGILGDIASPETVDQILEVVSAHGGIDILVSNAAVVRDGMSFMLPRPSWDTVLNVNLDGARKLTDTLLDRQLIRGHGRLIFIGSVAGLAGNVGQINYTTCKAGVRGLAGFYARTAPHDITSNAIIVGPTNTRLLKTLPDWILVIGHRLNALGQVGLPEDTSNVVTFVASDGSSAVNGQSLRCCGNALQGA